MNTKINDRLNSLAAQLVHLRKAESDAREARIRCEELIIETQDLGESERRTIKTSNGLKLTLQSGLSYSIDPDFPGPIKRKVTQELDVKAYERIRETNPELFADLQKFVTVRPRKTSVTVATV